MKIKHLSVFFLWLILFAFPACKQKKVHIGEKEIVESPQELQYTVSEVIEYSLEDAMENNGQVQDLVIRDVASVNYLYKKFSYNPLWTKDGKWEPHADSLLRVIKKVYPYGLFPEDYYQSRLDTLYARTVSDTSSMNKLDASLWAETDLVLTSAFVKLASDLKSGRLLPDSVRARDTIVANEFFVNYLDSFKTLPDTLFFSSLEPKHSAYHRLKNALSSFLEKADLRRYSFVDKNDSINLHRAVTARLKEDSIMVPAPDSTALAEGIKKFQLKKGMKPDGKLSAAVIERMNNNDRAKFIRVAISLDRYKQMSNLPANYIWVNIPSYQLKVIESDTVVLKSKVVVGKPETKTPLLTSTVTDMITYPLWTIPNSIVIKEILPELKKNPNYLTLRGYSLQDKDRKPVDALTVDWSKYEKSIPYLVVQGSGDANALGVLKFNFPNKYLVYLHDTNQRQYFSREKRALSHGCVRVQSWYELAEYLLNKDSLAVNRIPKDSLDQWLALKEKHVIPLRNRVPLYIRYFTCEAEEDRLVFHDDIYGTDGYLRRLYFNEK